MGMQLIGKNKSDEKVIQIGKYYEEIFNHSKIKPNIING
jgi:Asp-tRNA(Asn)/Glu-tRNA(Gln) amidotransferase A subunit family amidase